MGEDAGWTDTEHGYLAHSGIQGSEDPIVIIYQKSARYARKMSERFKAFGPERASKKQYKERNARSI